MSAPARSKIKKRQPSGRENVWGELVCSIEGNDAVPLKGLKYAFGKSPDNDYVVDMPGLKSRCCCYLWKDSSEKIWYCDQSPYGTYIKRTKKTVKMQSVQVEDGDTFYILKRKHTPGSFFFYIIVKLKQQQQAVGATAAAAEEENDLFFHMLEDDSFDAKVSALMEDLEKQDKAVDMPVSKKDRRKKSGEDDVASATTSKSPASQPKGPKRDALEEALLCSLCLEILYEPVSLQPCMHCYCAGCYSTWMQESNKCPQCRNDVERVGRNYVVSNMVEAYLQEHPEKQRSPSEIERLKKANKITSDMMNIKQAQKKVDDSLVPPEYVDPSDDLYSADLYESDTYDDYFGYSSDYDDTDYFFEDMISIFQRSASFVPFQHPVCRQCPNWNGRGNNSGASSSSNSAHSSVNSGASTSGASTSLPYICSVNQVHIKCQCCKEEMPDRKINNRLPEGIPPQYCTSCNRSFCHLYWACRRLGCKGCLNKFKDMNFGSSCLTNLLSNRYESSILKDYLEAKGLDWKYLLLRCLERLDNRRYVLQGTARVTSSTILCFTCALKYFKQLAYHFRKDIPVQELPDYVAHSGRPNCWWGKDCRMQRENNNHARRYNHMCEATRFL